VYPPSLLNISDSGWSHENPSQGPMRPPEHFTSSIPMHRSRPLPNTFTAILNTLWMCAYPDFKLESRVRGLVMVSRLPLA
jgi:hypothetical protein